MTSLAQAVIAREQNPHRGIQMIATAQLHRLAGLLVLFGALHVSGEPVEAQSSKAAPKKKTTTVQVPKVDVTASEGTTATAIRGRPATTAARKTVNAALRTALGKPAARNAARAEVIRQLRLNQPIAVVNGSWVSVFSVGSVYALPAIRTELLATLGPNGPQLVGGASAGAAGLVLVFTQLQVGRLLMPNIATDLEKSIGATAITNQMTDGFVGDFLGDIVVLIDVAQAGLGFIEGLIESGKAWVEGKSSYDPDADIDGDGIANWKDDDDDGDGVSDQKDNYPADPTKSICDCGRGRGIAFGTSVASGDLPALISVLNGSKLLTARVSLGPAVAGQAANIAMVF